ncbi:NUDIX hydrolase [Maliponia aquimaris]|uniref:Bifunctional nicotinamide mononucleotide adenylyltransferase/ADP-ribose pyrophosphatase n=1 Tax=Maliponia aquimaris TaxID=1673631 RepID=A0A238JNA7_9RHOB|nr:NUDIX domain-containing protein [Maliponia aquimaris]SMX32150.1 hypothetical protein MAA8898_00161 [Maliponia aquimaris]
MSRFADFPNPTLAVDIVALSVADTRLHCLLLRRDDAALVGGDWAFPGAVVHHGKPVEEAVARAAQIKAGLGALHLEQLATYGDPARDPRGHVVSVAWMAIAPHALLLDKVTANPDLCLAPVIVDWPGETGGPAQALGADGQPLRLAFDHAAILGDAVKRLRGKIDYSPIGFGFVPPRFTLRAVQEVHEAILGRPLTKPAFRRKLLDRHPLHPTGTLETGGAFRPAELYERDPAQEM